MSGNLVKLNERYESVSYFAAQLLAFLETKKLELQYIVQQISALRKHNLEILQTMQQLDFEIKMAQQAAQQALGSNLDMRMLPELADEFNNYWDQITKNRNILISAVANLAKQQSLTDKILGLKKYPAALKNRRTYMSLLLFAYTKLIKLCIHLLKVKQKIPVKSKSEDKEDDEKSKTKEDLKFKNTKFYNSHPIVTNCRNEILYQYDVVRNIINATPLNYFLFEFQRYSNAEFYNSSEIKKYDSEYFSLRNEINSLENDLERVEMVKTNLSRQCQIAQEAMESLIVKDLSQNQMQFWQAMNNKDLINNNEFFKEVLKQCYAELLAQELAKNVEQQKIEERSELCAAEKHRKDLLHKAYLFTLERFAEIRREKEELLRNTMTQPFSSRLARAFGAFANTVELDTETNQKPVTPISCKPSRSIVVENDDIIKSIFEANAAGWTAPYRFLRPKVTT